MAWKPKTIAGKILKGAVIGTGSILGLATGLGAMKGVVKGTGVIKGAITGLSSTKGVLNKVGASAVNLVTGTTKKERAQIAEIKTIAKTAKDKKEQVDRLMNAGATLNKALSMVGITKSEYEGSAIPDLETENETFATEQINEAETVKTAGFGSFLKGNTAIYVIGAIVALLFLPKLLKGR